MNLAQPIRDQELLSKIKKSLQKDPRSYMLFVMGINTGLRISDLLSLRVEDVKDKTHIKIKEQKTGKNKLFFINPSLTLELESYISDLKPNSFLFASKNNPESNISRFMAHRLLKKIADEFEVESFSAHSMRKTFGFFFYQRTKDIAILQKIFNHSSPSITLAYIGIYQLQMDESLTNFYL